MRRFLFWVFETLCVIGFVGFVLTIETLNWIPLVLFLLCVLGFIAGAMVDPDYIQQICSDND